MKVNNEVRAWGSSSVSYWVVLLVALGIIFVVVRFLLIPATAAADFGVPIYNEHDIAFGWIKGIRDIFSGIVLLPLLFFKMRRATAFVFTAAIIIPATDFLIILSTNGLSDVQHLLIHGLTAVYMMVTSFLLFKGSK